MSEADVTREVVDAALMVHSALGPGLLESVYEQCLARELSLRGLCVDRQVPLPVRYKGVCLDATYRLDLLVERCVVVEVKSVERLQPIHLAQILTYLRLGGFRLGLMLNFNTAHMRDGIKRVINGIPAGTARASRRALTDSV